MTSLDYAEIGITTNFSFLRGGSHPQEYVHQASELHLPAIGIADHNTLAGVVRAYKELGNPEVKHQPKLLIGSRIVFIDGTPDILVYPRDREAYGRLCQLLTLGKRGDDTEKGECLLKLDDLLEFTQGQLLVLALPHRFETATASRVLKRLQQSRAHGVWLAASLLYRGDDRRRLARLQRIAGDAGVPLLATNEVLYHHPARRPLQDVLTCIREKTTIEAIGRRLEA
ncbi:MAG TPA: PHP domain-containing protein, partial [Bradyrhizobium sp.]|nr:PHP domain-containing protein [Bradyrhizobium sp.]